MSKAFTREDDAAPERLPVARPFSIPGGKNYLTPAGAQKLREELEQLSQNPIADTSLADKQRVRYLQDSLAAAVIVPPPAQPWEQVLFGATVTLRDDDGETSRYRIVGMDEADLDRDWISWLSPIARALLKARLGERVKIRTPGGERSWEVAAIHFE